MKNSWRFIPDTQTGHPGNRHKEYEDKEGGRRRTCEAGKKTPGRWRPCTRVLVI